MSNKSFFVLLGAVLSPFAIIWTVENMGVSAGLLLFFAASFGVISHFRKHRDI